MVPDSDAGACPGGLLPCRAGMAVPSCGERQRSTLRRRAAPLASPTHMEPCSSPAFAIGVDVGGTKIEAVALAADGAERWRRRVATPAGGVPATPAAAF